jgi:signal transduction histidine kinase
VHAALTAARPLLRDQRVDARSSFDVDDDSGAPLRGSIAALERAVLNLIVNAVQAMEGQSNAKELHVEVSGSKAQGGFLLMVTDTGPGFPPGLESRAFERFVTTKPPGKGTGLGLWIVRETVAQFGGSVTVEAASGRGACVRLHFPLSSVDGVEDTAPARAESHRSTRSARVGTAA